MCYGLEPPKWNCERLFNLLCQGGTTNHLLTENFKSFGNYKGFLDGT
jgi:hypothetical protein